MPGDPPGVVKSGGVGRQKVMPLAGQGEIIVAVEPQLDGPPGQPRAQRRQRRPLAGLALLAAETAAHPPAHNGDRALAHAQHLGDDVLHFVWVLRRGMHQHLPTLAGNGQRDLPFKVEMFLPADAQRAFHPTRRGGNDALRRASPEGIVRQHPRFELQRGLHIHHRRFRLDLDHA